MLKFLLLSLLSVHVLGQPADIILSSPVSEPRLPVKGDRNDREFGVETFTVPFPKHGLGLTTGDLKLFSGHALNLLKSKCPNVDPKVIFQLQKYFGKQIARVADPVPGDNKKFRDVLATVTTCSADVVPRVNERKTPIEQLTDSIYADSSEEDFTKDYVKEKKLIPVYPKESPLSAPNWKAKWSEMTSAEKKAELDNVFDKDFKAKLSSSSTTKKPTTTVRTTTPSTENPSSPVVIEQTQATSPFVAWISNAFTSITNFFSRIFGFGNRRRRDTSLDDDSIEAGGPIIITAFGGPLSGVGQFNHDENIPKGQIAFQKLMNGICRVYCDKCRNGINALQFKIAGRELLDYLFAHVPAKGIELAASNYLTPEFLREIAQCFGGTD